MGLRSTPCLWKLCLCLHFFLGYLVYPTMSFSTRTGNPSVSRSLHTPSVNRFRMTHNVPTVAVLQLRSKSKDSEDDTDSSHVDMDSSLFDLNPSMEEEIRLDATLASCYILCRFLIYDITTGVKDVPGWQIQDWIDLANVASSCIVLSSLWTVVGLGTGIFSLDETDRVDDGTKVLLSALLVGPLWISAEIWNQWPPNDMGLFAYGLNSLPMGMVWDAIATGTLGLACIMILGKTVASNLRY